MLKFVFKFEDLLHHRRGARDLARKRFGEARDVKIQLDTKCSNVILTRESLIRDLRLLTGTGTVSIGRSVSRQDYARQLLLQLSELAEQQQEAETDVKCRERDLVQADQDVKTLENLRDRQHREFLYDQSRRDAHSLEDHCSAARLRPSALLD